MEKLYLLLTVLISVISIYMVIIAKVTIPAPIAMIFFGTLLVSFANLKSNKEKQ